MDEEKQHEEPAFWQALDSFTRMAERNKQRDRDIRATLDFLRALASVERALEEAILEELSRNDDLVNRVFQTVVGQRGGTQNGVY